MNDTSTMPNGVTRRPSDLYFDAGAQRAAFTNFVGDAAQPFTVYVGAYTATSATNVFSSVRFTSRR